MKFVILGLIALLFFACNASALDAVIKEMEGTKRTYVFHINLSKQMVETTTKAPGETIPSIQRYIVKQDGISGQKAAVLVKLMTFSTRSIQKIRTC